MRTGWFLIFFILLLSSMPKVALAQSTCIAGFTYTQTNLNFNFTSTSNAGGTAVIVSGLWSFGDGNTSGALNPAHTYASPGMYIINHSIITSSGCFDNFTDTVYATGVCTASFTVDSSQPPFLNFIASPSVSGLSYSWNFGDGSVDSSGPVVSHLYLPGYYNACVTISDTSGLCNSMFCDTVYAGAPSCNSGFTATVDRGHVLFTPDNLNGGWIYSWDFGDGTIDTAMIANHAYSGSGTYQVCLTVTDTLLNCTSTYCDSVEVTVNCQSTFTYLNTGASVNFIADTISPFWQYSWTYGDGTPGDTGIYQNHVYASSGLYQVCLTVTDTATGCSNTTCEYVVILIHCNALFNTTINSGGMIVFQITPFDTNLDYTFDFGDSTTGTGIMGFAYHQYAVNGTYRVCLTVTNPSTGCTSEYCDDVTILVSGIEENDDRNGVVVFPNPFMEAIHVSKKDQGELEYQLLDITGRVLKWGIIKEGENEIGGSGLASGVYFLVTNPEEERKVYRLVRN